MNFIEHKNKNDSSRLTVNIYAAIFLTKGHMMSASNFLCVYFPGMMPPEKDDVGNLRDEHFPATFHVQRHDKHA